MNIGDKVRFSLSFKRELCRIINSNYYSCRIINSNYYSTRYNVGSEGDRKWWRKTILKYGSDIGKVIEASETRLLIKFDDGETLWMKRAGMTIVSEAEHILVARRNNKAHS